MSFVTLGYHFFDVGMRSFVYAQCQAQGAGLWLVGVTDPALST